MKKIKILLLLFGLGVASSLISKSVSKKELKANFQTLPADVRTGVYWHWMNDNISVEDVQKYPEAMKRAGITKVFIGNISGETQFSRGELWIKPNQAMRYLDIKKT
jgi:hypothetical protein